MAKRLCVVVLFVLSLFGFAGRVSAVGESVQAVQIGLDRPVVLGSAATVVPLLNAGNVVDVFGNCPIANRDCPVWLAGHRTTHGAPFLNVPSLNVGDTVTVNGIGFVVVWKVTIDSRHALFSTYVTPGAVGLWLQTCDGNTHDVLIHADRIRTPFTQGSRTANPTRLRTSTAQ